MHGLTAVSGLHLQRNSLPVSIHDTWADNNVRIMVCVGLNRAFDRLQYTVFCSGVLEYLVDIFACISLNVVIVTTIFTFISRR